MRMTDAELDARVAALSDDDLRSILQRREDVHKDDPNDPGTIGRMLAYCRSDALLTRLVEETLRLRAVEADYVRLLAIFNEPRVMMSGDGREPTRNEWHLCNLLEWARHGERQAKEGYAHEIARLQKIIEGMAGRIAAAHDVIAKKAERRPKTPTQLLVEWLGASRGTRTIDIDQDSVTLVDDQEVGKTLRLFVYEQPARLVGWGPEFAAGTYDKPASLDEMILFALAKWRELYGGKGGE